MGTITAHILVGSPHPNHGGINPTHFLFLTENDRPAWILVNENVFKKDQADVQNVTWIPTVENMLEDAMLMIAIHVSKNQEIIALSKSFNPAIEVERVQLYTALEEVQREQLYLKCRSISDFPKIVVSVLRGSTIDKQLTAIEKYKMDVEICRVGYSRLYSAWVNETTIEGSLNKI